MSAALTPRVRAMIQCDEVIASDLEVDVFTLEGVRQHLSADGFPFLTTLQVALFLSCPRAGEYFGAVRLLHQADDRWLRYQKFQVDFTDDTTDRLITIPLRDLRIRHPGWYTVEVLFFPHSGGEVQKGEVQLRVDNAEE